MLRSEKEEIIIWCNGRICQSFNFDAILWKLQFNNISFLNTTAISFQGAKSTCFLLCLQNANILQISQLDFVQLKQKNFSHKKGSIQVMQLNSRLVFSC